MLPGEIQFLYFPLADVGIETLNFLCTVNFMLSVYMLAFYV